MNAAEAHTRYLFSLMVTPRARRALKDIYTEIGEEADKGQVNLFFRISGILFHLHRVEVLWLEAMLKNQGYEVTISTENIKVSWHNAGRQS